MLQTTSVPRRTPDAPSRAQDPEDSAVPTRYRRSTPVPELPRHRGFLGVNRRTLAFGSLASSALLLSIPALPASADVVVAEVEITNLQTFAAPAFVPTPVVE